MEINWPAVFPAILQGTSIFIGSAGAFAVYRGAHRKADLKTELEILKLLDQTDPNYPKVKAHVAHLMGVLYGPKVRPWWLPRVYNWSALLVGSFVSILGFSGAAYRYRMNENPAAIFIGVYGLVGLTLALNAFNPKFATKQDATPLELPTNTKPQGGEGVPGAGPPA